MTKGIPTMQNFVLLNVNNPHSSSHHTQAVVTISSNRSVILSLIAPTLAILHHTAHCQRARPDALPGGRSSSLVHVGATWSMPHPAPVVFDWIAGSLPRLPSQCPPLRVHVIRYADGMIARLSCYITRRNDRVDQRGFDHRWSPIKHLIT